MAAESDDLEKTYTVPGHLTTGETIGPIPGRLFYSCLIAIVFAPLLGLAGYTTWGWPVAIGLGLIVVVVVLPFGMWWLKPPFEHGLLAWLMYRPRPRLRSRSRSRSRPRPRSRLGISCTQVPQLVRIAHDVHPRNLPILDL